MSEPRRVLLVGATGLIGSSVMKEAVDQPWLRIVALSRREASMPRGVPMEMLVAEPQNWPQAIAAIEPDAVICALGTTMRRAGGEDAFRAVDHDLVLSVGKAARAANVQNFVLVSSAGANPHAKAFYLAVKGEVETALSKLRLRRLDILRPGLLRGPRAEARLLERLAILASPLADLVLVGGNARYRSIDAHVVAAAAIQCAREKAQGRFVHDNASMDRLARRLAGPA